MIKSDKSRSTKCRLENARRLDRILAHARGGTCGNRMNRTNAAHMCIGTFLLPGATVVWARTGGGRDWTPVALQRCKAWQRIWSNSLPNWGVTQTRGGGGEIQLKGRLLLNASCAAGRGYFSWCSSSWRWGGNEGRQPGIHAVIYPRAVKLRASPIRFDFLCLPSSLFLFGRSFSSLARFSLFKANA